MSNEVKIHVGMIVDYAGGNYRVSMAKGGKVNLKSIFGNTIYYKGISADLVKDDHDGWYQRWSKSDAYSTM